MKTLQEQYDEIMAVLEVANQNADTLATMFMPDENGRTINESNLVTARTAATEIDSLFFRMERCMDVISMLAPLDAEQRVLIQKYTERFAFERNHIADWRYQMMACEVFEMPKVEETKALTETLNIMASMRSTINELSVPLTDAETIVFMRAVVSVVEDHELELDAVVGENISKIHHKAVIGWIKNSIGIGGRTTEYATSLFNRGCLQFFPKKG